MKELSIQEKAKRYDMVSKEVKDFFEGKQKMYSDVEQTLEYLFPEYKESDNEKTERILHSISSKISLHLCDIFTEEEFQCFDTWSNAWLEKQDKQEQLYIRFGEIPTYEKSKIYHGEKEIGEESGVSVYPAFEVNGNIVLGLTLPITKTTLYTQQHLLEYDNRPCYLVEGNYVGKDTDGQPLINNVHIIKKIDSYRVNKEKQGEQKPIDNFKPKFKIGDWVVLDGETLHITNVTENGYSTEYGVIPFRCEKETKLWTIEDARPGDVLAEEPIDSYPFPFVAIYKKQNEEEFDSYCFIGFNGKFYEGEMGHSTENIHPATKEQCDILFKEMKNAGYEWNAENLQLTKILHVKELSDGINIDKQKLTVWSEENEDKEAGAEEEMGCEEDLERINRIADFIWKNRKGDTDEIYQQEQDVNWLKSLKESITWKPNDKQMHAFEQVYDWYNNNFMASETLTSLYNDLKKLQGK